MRMCDGYVVDAASVSVMYHSNFYDRCRGWGLNPKKVRYEVSASGDLDAKESGDIADYFSSVFEAKSTRADFLSTFGGRENAHSNRLKPVAHLHWVVTEKGVCDPSEIPLYWGLLVRRGRGLSEVRRPDYCTMSDVDILRLESRLLWKPAKGCGVFLPCCPNCNGPIDNDGMAWNARIPHHLMEDDAS